MAKSPEEMAQSMIDNMPEKTGKDLAGWLKIVKATELDKHGKIVNLLKQEHGVTHGFANLIAHHALKAGVSDTGDDPIADQYSGPKAGLLPIYKALLGHIESLGNDVELAPKKGYVSLRRKKQFALIQPSTKTRVDVGIQLKSEQATDRLELSKSWNAMVSHRVRVTDVAQVDNELIDWIREAYDKAG